MRQFSQRYKSQGEDIEIIILMRAMEVLIIIILVTDIQEIPQYF